MNVRELLGPAGVESAYENVKERINQADDDKAKSGDGLVINLLHEKAQELSKFATKKETPKSKLMDGNYDEPTEMDEDKIRRQI